MPSILKSSVIVLPTALQNVLKFGSFAAKVMDSASAHNRHVVIFLRHCMLICFVVVLFFSRGRAT